MKNYNITVRVNEWGLHICDAACVRQDFGRDLYYNQPVESVCVDLTPQEREMVYRFRTRYPAQPPPETFR
jgi:hypothetical protein